MKRKAGEELERELAAQLDQLGIEVEPGRRTQIVRFLLAILLANEKVNLTSITEPGAALRLHVTDSLTAMHELNEAPRGRCLDLGSGGGFPGVPLAVASGREFTLLDSVTKKGEAVKRALSELGYQIPVIEVAGSRAENHAITHCGAYSAVVARAVAPLPSLVELSSPLLTLGGVLIAMKGCPEASERRSGTAVARLVGMREIGWRQFTLPSGGEARTIVTYARTGASSVRLPRRTGLAQHSPLR